MILTRSDTAICHLQRALQSARKIESKALTLECTTLLALIAELRGDKEESAKIEAEWNAARSSRSGNLSDTVRKIGEIVKMVGVRLAENWT